MELWIRSQDRTFLRKVNTIGIVEGRDFWSIDENLTVSFGKFKTKERALEVLDEIQNVLKPIFKINYEYDDSQPIIDGEWLKSLKAESKIEELSCYVYEMPKE